MYDIPYLAGRINRILGEKSMKDLSPWGLVSQDEVYIVVVKTLHMISVV